MEDRVKLLENTYRAPKEINNDNDNNYITRDL